MSRTAKATLCASFFISSLIIWGVHFQQNQERENMYKGVLRDDERRKEKMKKREEEFQASLRKREVYERVQTVVTGDATEDT
ncbi:hypothetical protein SERLA73DRAFT_93462 [Serpula lacrymans var. lacrymans S7.3]|uniref:Cytochrome c oxidase assembly protein n=2 Tax=Serpula lacrymans var. lacrymans TaxID=341189 RepID=F8Q3X7_SERL3|nr:uncharacterized protein SERLADRAFT_451286 [Serpula lacrymans var. lacrymans S7.9]EGN96833.1 hypothetical protein SERLA73DRAFT_93462 [Serpula lacrymans var. lacrymans S7.3]EGO22435.1 hypothetical protein SERLADRAFT_451286 [Serpula lacrymans var. lacrymans S7.9]